jgi:hypothetical protein
MMCTGCLPPRRQHAASLTVQDGRSRQLSVPHHFALTDLIGNGMDGNSDGTGATISCGFTVSPAADGFLLKVGSATAQRRPPRSTGAGRSGEPSTAELYGSGSIDPSGDEDYWKFDAGRGSCWSTTTAARGYTHLDLRLLSHVTNDYYQGRGR